MQSTGVNEPAQIYYACWLEAEYETLICSGKEVQ